MKKSFKTSKFFKVESNWELFENQFSTVIIDNMDSFLIQSLLNKGTKAFIENLYKPSKREYCIQLMSLPEYQMC